MSPAIAARIRYLQDEIAKREQLRDHLDYLMRNYVSVHIVTRVAWEENHACLCQRIKKIQAEIERLFETPIDKRYAELQMPD